MLWTASQGYRPLYGSQEKVETAQIIEVLETEGISYRLDTNSGLVLVPEDRLGKARMILAARGVKAQMPMGMESLDSSGIGTSQFMEQAKYRYSLEGELSRTIMALRAVRTARVHLAIPKKPYLLGSNLNCLRHQSCLISMQVATFNQNRLNRLSIWLQAVSQG